MFSTSSRNFHKSAPAQVFGIYDGILLVDKPREWTSHDVVAKIRRQFNFEKVGHGGTLDPNATGLLVILLGKGTSLSDRIMGGDKTYEGEILLGRATDTQDILGDDLETKMSAEARDEFLREITAEKLQAEMQKFTGDLWQLPPMYSAVKINGRPLYKAARKGSDVEREPRLIHVYSFKLSSFSTPLGAFEVKCGKGCYIRTLCHDIGESFGCGACLQSLRRTRSGDFTLAEALPLEELLALDKPQLARRIIPITRFLHN